MTDLDSLVSVIEVSVTECYLIVKAIEYLSEHPEWLSSEDLHLLKGKYVSIAIDLRDSYGTCRGCDHCVALPKGAKCFHPGLEGPFKEQTHGISRMEDITIQQPWCPLLENPGPLPLDPDRYIKEDCPSCGVESFFQAKIGLCMGCVSKEKTNG